MNKFILFALCMVALASMAFAQDAKVCPQGEVYNSCGTACPEHCPIRNPVTGQLETQNMACIKMCVPGCFCANGTVRDLKRDNACVNKAICTFA